MGEASKGLRTQDQTIDKDNRSEDFWWSSSFIEMDHSATQSQRSISSIAVSNHPSDPHPSDPQSSADIQTDPPEFVNQGLLLWNQVRQQWVGNRRSERRTQVGEPRISLRVFSLTRFLQSTLYKYQTELPSLKGATAFSKQVGKLIERWESWNCWNATYESLLGTSKRFPQPIPLGEMVDFLVDIWELEGLYD